MGRYHSDFMKDLFPHQNATGVDLGNVEIKETNSISHQYTLKPSDKNAEFILFYDHSEDCFFIVNGLEMPKFRKRRSISTSQVKKLAYFETKKIGELRKEMIEILNDPIHVPKGHELEELRKIQRENDLKWKAAIDNILAEVDGILGESE